MTQAFIDELTHLADSARGPHLTAVLARLQRPVGVAVTGRIGVGRGSVAGALRRHGVTVAPAGAEVDVRSLVVAETVKAEDLDAVRSGRPDLIVLTKADLAGRGEGGPLAVARRRAAAIRRRTGVPTVPLVGSLAALDPLDDDMVAALRRFATEPPDLAGVDAFVEHPHSVSPAVRARLLERLDRFGIAHALLALADGCEPRGLPARLAEVSNLAEVLVALDAAAAPARYRRLRTALREIRALAVTAADAGLAELLADDVTAMAAMTAAVDVLEAAGLSVDRGDTAAAHLDRAVRWRRYGRGPVDALHGHCSADVVRGSLRLLAGVRRSP